MIGFMSNKLKRVRKAQITLNLNKIIFRSNLWDKKEHKSGK